MQASRRRILVADDEPAIRDLIRTRLAMSGYDVHTSRTGVEALSRLSSLPLDAMILDINMPEMDGFSVLAAMALLPARQRIPTLVLTARHSSTDLERAIGLGAKDYLTKPFSEGQLLARVQRVLRRVEPPDPRLAI